MKGLSGQPLVSFITINFNQLHYTLALIESIKQLTYPSYEIIVVDNASDENPKETIRSCFPDVKVICSKTNLGFAGGNNLGIRQSKGDYIFLINNDTEVIPYLLEPMIDCFKQNPSIGAISPKIIYKDTGLIQYAGAIAINPVTGRGRKIGHLEKDAGQYDEIRETELCHGAAMMIPAEVIKKVGEMPELYFLYYEEHDWVETIKREGYKIFYVGLSKVYHKESASVGKSSALKSYYMNRNRILYMRRNFTGLHFYISMLLFVTLALPKLVLSHIIKREFQLLFPVFRSLWWNVTNRNI